MLPRRKSPWTIVAWCLESGQVLAEPAPHVLHGGDLARLVELPQAAEAAQLALEIAGRLAEALEARRAPVDRVDLHQRVDQLLADPASLVRASSSDAGTLETITSPRTRSIT